MITWHSRQYIKNQYLLFVGIAYLFIGSIDLLHTLAYQGMPIFSGYDFIAAKLWIGARYMESISLLLAFLFLYLGKPIRTCKVFIAYCGISTLLILSIFYWKVFPECFGLETGLTPFKKICEYIICFILLLDVYLLHKNKEHFDEKVFQLLLWSFLCTIASELAFTFYISMYGFSNLVGHYFKIFSFILLYLAIIRTGIEKPYELIFRDLTKANKGLSVALEEIKTLKGILPICMYCKKIRDDKGYWNQIDKYIRDHSDAEISHGICPNCLKEHYSGFLTEEDDI